MSIKNAQPQCATPLEELLARLIEDPETKHWIAEDLKQLIPGIQDPSREGVYATLYPRRQSSISIVIDCKSHPLSEVTADMVMASLEAVARNIALGNMAYLEGAPYYFIEVKVNLNFLTKDQRLELLKKSFGPRPIDYYTTGWESEMIEIYDTFREDEWREFLGCATEFGRSFMYAPRSSLNPINDDSLLSLIKVYHEMGRFHEIHCLVSGMSNYEAGKVFAKAIKEIGHYMPYKDNDDPFFEEALTVIRCENLDLSKYSLTVDASDVHRVYGALNAAAHYKVVFRTVSPRLVTGFVKMVCEAPMNATFEALVSNDSDALYLKGDFYDEGLWESSVAMAFEFDFEDVQKHPHHQYVNRITISKHRGDHKLLERR